MSKIDELLSVLGMTEEEQWDWLVDNPESEFWPDAIFYGERERYIADLAFRLRDEVIKTNIHKYIKAKLIITEYMSKIKKKTWLYSTEAQPIHWIIAALIAKEQSEK